MNFVGDKQATAADCAIVPIYWPCDCDRTVEGPLSFGVPLPMGCVRDASRAWLVGPLGEKLAAQTEVLARWPDGSVRWLLMDACVASPTDLSGTWHAHVEDGAREHVAFVSSERPSTPKAAKPSVCLVTRYFEVSFNRRGSWRAVAPCLEDDGKELSSCGAAVAAVGDMPKLTDEHGKLHAATVSDVCLVANGPVRATVEVRARFARLRGVNLVVRWNFYRESPLITADVTLHNPNPARHRGGIWDLGDPGSILFKDFSLPVALAGNSAAEVSLQCEASGDWQTANDGCFKLHQESSGGENWKSANHVNRDRIVPMRYCGYQGDVSGQSISGRRASPTAKVVVGSATLEARIAEFWQQFPKGMDCDRGMVRLRLFPGDFGDLHELQGGEQKTHRVELTLEFKKELSTVVMEQAARPTQSLLDRRFCVAPRLMDTQLPGLPRWESADEAVLARLDRLAEEYLVGPRGLYASRERVDDYGWRNYGDIHASHEELHYKGSQPLVSHYNNQFDFIAGCILQYMRTGDARWWQIADPLARHVIDIDIYHTSRDRAAYSGGMFWFTDHYLHAHTSSHRTYSRYNAEPGKGYGGGPGSEHNFSTGLMLYHLLTGNPWAKDAVRSLAEWVLAMDDGRKTLLGAVDDGPTGLASRPQSPGRGVGNSVNTLLDGWLLFGERKYLDYAEALIRRCIHPSDRLEELDLLNAEKSWSYTVFLVSLDKYLRCKGEAREHDSMWDYGRASLLHYGRWMLENERPYMDDCGQFEYVTEAWAAQEFRKANALRLAASYAEAPLATAMLERGQELADRAWDDLESFETRTTARAMAVLLIEGVRDADLRQARDYGASAVANFGDIEPAQRFVPQRERVKRKLLSLRGWGSLAAVAIQPQRWQRLMNHR